MWPCALSALNMKPRRAAFGIFLNLALATTVAGAAHAQNRQAISISLTECSVIFSGLADLGLRRNKPQSEIREISATATAFREEALSQAQQEGQPDPQNYVLIQTDRLADKWLGRFGKIGLLQENKDWIDYCRALGKSRKIPLP